MKCLGITKKIAITSGFGESDTSKLNAFDNALIDAGIHDCNLIKVSSILAKNTKITKKFMIEKGSFVPCVLSTQNGLKKEIICSGIGIGFNNQKYGFVMEAKGKNENKVTTVLEKKLGEMAKNRKQKIIQKKIITKKAKINKKYGCVITAVIYLF
ncbi:MAG: pyruvoyl-dependent arginine decarboxylase [Candidatus ainarchaeum sp.]|nr:pyruvoyl-dependent arginine decarboxylase [Candidatus ainarchaeum sp.]